MVGGGIPFDAPYARKCSISFPRCELCYKAVTIVRADCRDDARLWLGVPVKLTGTYRRLVRDTTINDRTLLSTDYLNHYNELVMMLEMVGDMPDMLGEAETWTPKTYQQHFQGSSFQHKDLAIWAYENAPDEYRVPMDDCIGRIDAAIEQGLPLLRQLADAGDHEALKIETAALTTQMRARIDTMSALINGVMDAKAYNAVLEEDEPSVSDAAPKASVMDQAGIDALFD